MSIPADFMEGESGFTVLKTTAIAGLVANATFVAAFGGSDETIRATVDRLYSGLSNRAELSHIPELNGKPLLTESELAYCAEMARDLGKGITISANGILEF